MTPFLVYWPLAIAVFAVMDEMKGKRPMWIPNIAVSAAIWGIMWAFHRGANT